MKEVDKFSSSNIAEPPYITMGLYASPDFNDFHHSFEFAQCIDENNWKQALSHLHDKICHKRYSILWGPKLRYHAYQNHIVM